MVHDTPSRGAREVGAPSFAVQIAHGKGITKLPPAPRAS